MFQKSKSKILLIISILTIIVIFPYKSFHHFINPHYLDNIGVTIDDELFSSDSSSSVLYYTLDIGARGTASYQTIISNKNYGDNLMKYNLPPQLIILGWTSDNKLLVEYNPNMAFHTGGGLTDLNLKKDTLERNGVEIIIKKRVRENRDSVVYQNFGQYQ